jgi:diguanylate cyclase
VDDERPNRELLEIILASEGFLVLTAASSEEALATVAQQLPDLILLDVMMPGMDGFQVTATIRSNLALVSATASPDARMLGLRAGADDFLSKPLDRDVLVSQVKRVLRETYADYRDS